MGTAVGDYDFGALAYQAAGLVDEMGEVDDRDCRRDVMGFQFIFINVQYRIDRLLHQLVSNQKSDGIHFLSSSFPLSIIKKYGINVKKVKNFLPNEPIVEGPLRGNGLYISWNELAWILHID